MKNLAGNKDADKIVREELYLAGIPMENEDSKGEVPYKTIGRIGSWTFHRAWTYWIASVPDKVKGLPLSIALEMHNRKHPTDDNQIMGSLIRSGGHCGCPSPDDYGAQPVYDDELDEQLIKLGYKKEYCEFLKKSYIHINVGEVSRLCNEGKLTVGRYVDCYHIDDQIGLNVFAEVLKKETIKELSK
jgi:hypothetical protein